MNRLNKEDMQEFINLDVFLLTDSDKFLMQYIFLTKLNLDDLEHANSQLQKISVKTLVKYLKKGEDNKYYAYLTIKDLKNFYQYICSKKGTLPKNTNYHRVTFLEEEDLKEYEG
jgi:hypothetical protein